MRCGHLIFLGAVCLFLAGCSEIEIHGTGPAGRSLPVDRRGEHSPTLAVQRPSRRPRRNAEWGRLVRPGENASCLASVTGSPCCDFPVWLHEAQKFNGLYAGHNLQDASNAAMPRLFNNPEFNEYGENLALVHMWNHAILHMRKQRKYRIYDKRAPWSGIFAHWCLTQVINPRTKTAYEGVAGDPSVVENWLKYGKACEPCFGALMVVNKNGSRYVIFCVGASVVPVRADDGIEEYKKVYLGFGGDQGNRVCISVIEISDVEAFRLPVGYRPCREHFKLEHSAWGEPYRQVAISSAVPVAI